MSVAEPLHAGDDRFEKIPSEPLQGLGSLNCPVIRRPKFAAPVSPKERNGQYAVQVQQQRLPE